LKTSPPSLTHAAADADDAALVARCRAGDAAAFEALVRRHWRATYAGAFAVMRNVMDAEDVTQDAMMRALERLEECRDASKFGAWLGQIARRHAFNALDARRVRATELLAAETAAEDTAIGADTALLTEQHMLRGRLISALEKLSPFQRNVVLLHDHDGRTHKEIGAIVGCSEGMSQQHLFAARKILRRHLGVLRDG
jgi:RNA polymerase sigma-70 factor (ECF subfamily)